MNENPTCNLCNHTMTEIKYDNVDKCIYRCPRHKHRKVSIRNGSILQGTTISLGKFIVLLCFWAIDMSGNKAAKLINVSENCVVLWYKKFRAVCVRWHAENPCRIGGPDSIVEIDECRLTKRKFHVGRGTRQFWIFGGYDRNTKQIFLCKLTERSQQIISPLIISNIRAGTTIYSDNWGAYQNISSLPVNPSYSHLTVNHAENFVDPISGAHTNNIECLWKNLKKKIKLLCGVQHNLIDEYISEFLWRYSFGKSYEATFDNMLMFISLQFSQ